MAIQSNSTLLAVIATAVLLVLVSISSVAAAPGRSRPLLIDGDFYVGTPGGLVLEHCVGEIPSGSSVIETDNGVWVHEPTGEKRRVPDCVGRNATNPSVRPPAPSNGYDGWLAYTAYHATTSNGADEDISAFLGYFSVPDLPAEIPEVLYLFTGLQNIDWIPKVDSYPEKDFDIIQPVLQFPGDGGDYWSVKSWYVTLRAGALNTREERCEPGDKIFGNMTRVGATAYDIVSVVDRTGKSVTLHASNKRLSIQPWAYNTLECYGCESCNFYPQKPIQFTDLQLIGHGGERIVPKWEDTPKPPVKKLCNERVSDITAGSVTIDFQ